MTSVHATFFFAMFFLQILTNKGDILSSSYSWLESWVLVDCDPDLLGQNLLLKEDYKQGAVQQNKIRDSLGLKTETKPSWIY